MRSLFTLLMLLLTAAVSSAQTTNQSTKHDSSIARIQRAAAMVLSHNPNTALLQAAKTTGVHQRVIAKTDTRDVLDSCAYKYSGTRGSTYDYNLLDYPDNKMFGTNTPKQGLLGYYAPIAVLCDTMIDYNSDTMGHSGISYYEAYVYDSSNNLKIYYYLDTSGESQGNPIGYYWVAQYDSTNYVVQAQAQTMYDGYYPENATMIGYFYDSLHRMTLQEVFTYNIIGQQQPAHNSYYNYDTSGNLVSEYGIYWDGNQWDSSYRNLFTYDSNNRITDIKNDIWGWPDTWNPQSEYIFGYTAGADFYTSSALFVYNSVNEANDTFDVVTKHLNAQNLPDTIQEYYNPNLANGQHLTGYMSYDSSSNPLSILWYANANATVPARVQRYYYETYGTPDPPPPPPPNSVANVTAAHAISVYPNPASGSFYIAAGTAANKRLTITMTNAAGATVLRNCYLNSGQPHIINAYSLRPGTYWLTVQDDSGNYLQRQTIVKL